MVLLKLAKKFAERNRKMTDQKKPEVAQKASNASSKQSLADPAGKTLKSSAEYPGLADLDSAIQNRQVTGFLEERSMPLRYIWYFAGFIVVIFVVLLILI